MHKLTTANGHDVPMVGLGTYPLQGEAMASMARGLIMKQDLDGRMCLSKRKSHRIMPMEMNHWKVFGLISCRNIKIAIQ